MAEHRATVEKLIIEDHPNADALELAVIGAYRSVVRKGQFKTGGLGVYIPEQTVLPTWLLKEMNLWDDEKNKGMLAGKQGNRVKPIKLRKQLSQGLVYPVIDNTIKVFESDGNSYYKIIEEGEDVTDVLGIEKYEPPIPTHMSGAVFNASGKTIKYDIENWKKYPNIIQEDEDVVFTEKLHGTWTCLGKYKDEYIVSSKGLSAKGLAFKLNEENKNNLYVRQFLEYGGKEIVDTFDQLIKFDTFHILGEIFGKGVQDLNYGLSVPEFRIFDIHVGNPSCRQDAEKGYYLSYFSLKSFVDMIDEQCDFDVRMVPTLYKGPFDKNIMNDYTKGHETISGKHKHLKEGIVIKPFLEREDSELGRVILKNVSEGYLLRKGNATEYN